MSVFAIIGGSGLTDYPDLIIDDVREVETPFGSPSAALRIGQLQGRQVVFLPRHGDKHRIAPHRINYRANLYALKQVGATHVLAVAAVGGIHEPYGPGTLSVPDQLIDYTYDREHSFFSDDFSVDKHIDFTWPYDQTLRKAMLDAGRVLGLALIDGGTYGAVQGPRLETAAEIRRMARDGCDLVGMTGMPEAGLAREIGLPYATLAVVANWAAGVKREAVSLEDIHRTLAAGLEKARELIAAVIALPLFR